MIESSSGIWNPANLAIRDGYGVRRQGTVRAALMKSRRQAGLVATAVLPVLFVATMLLAQQDQHALAQQILQGAASERQRAFGQAQALEPRQMGPELRAALITLLDRNNKIVAEAAKRKEAVAKLENPEFIAHVAHVVSELQDPQAIPALAGALGSGSTLVRDALADFGERAAPAVLAVVTAPESRYTAVNEGLLSLRYMVEGKGSPPLSPETLNQIRGAAKQRLMGKQRFTTLWRAIDLAVTLNDPELRQLVQSLASDANEVIARGVTDPGLIADTQKQASGRLAGGPSRPHYRSPAERARLSVPNRQR